MHQRVFSHHLELSDPLPDSPDNMNRWRSEWIDPGSRIRRQPAPYTPPPETNKQRFLSVLEMDFHTSRSPLQIHARPEDLDACIAEDRYRPLCQGIPAVEKMVVCSRKRPDIQLIRQSQDRRMISDTRTPSRAFNDGSLQIRNACVTKTNRFFPCRPVTLHYRYVPKKTTDSALPGAMWPSFNSSQEPDGSASTTRPCAHRPPLPKSA